MLEGVEAVGWGGARWAVARYEGNVSGKTLGEVFWWGLAAAAGWW